MSLEVQYIPQKGLRQGTSKSQSPAICSNYYDCTSNMKSDATILKNHVKL